MDGLTLLKFLQYHPLLSRKDIAEGMKFEGSDATLKRMLSAQVLAGNITVNGQGKATRYSLTNSCLIAIPIDIDTYFQHDQDEREIKSVFNFELITQILPSVTLFNEEEKQRLESLHVQFEKNMSELSPTSYRKEMERLGVDLSWKSSQIEGNTYSLLETERLLRESKTASGKTQEEAIMLLNHKYTLRFFD